MIKREIEIEKLGINGEGVTHIDGKICFVKGAIPGANESTVIVKKAVKK